MVNTSSSGMLSQVDTPLIYFHGQTEMFLVPPPGEPTFNILKLARPELRYQLSTTLHTAAKKNAPETCDGLQIRRNGSVYTFDIVVRPMPDQSAGTMLVLFEMRLSAREKQERDKQKTGRKSAPNEDPRIESMTQELKSTREYLQTTIEELETSNEELKSTNEELQSTNEELQSANEELETSKEELQSTNEELGTVNSELQNKIDELSQSNDDLNNLLAGTQICTIFLDTNLRIKRFTPVMTQLFNLIKSDIGRPISDITSIIMNENILEHAEQVLNTLNQKELEISTRDKKIYNMRILPYRTTENVIDGVVMTFIDITELRNAETALSGALSYTEGIVDTVREPLLVLDKDLRVISANRSFYEKFKVSRNETENQLIYKTCSSQWDIPKLRELLEHILSENTSFDDFQVEHDFPGIGHKKMLLNARRIIQEGQGTEMILLAIEDVTV